MNLISYKIKSFCTKQYPNAPPFIDVTSFLQQSQGTLQTTTASDPQIIQPEENL